MRNVIALIVVTLVLWVSAIAEQPGETDMDKTKIEKVALDYIEGWYAGDHERMENALHPDLAKRGIMKEETTGRTIVRETSAYNMVEYTRADWGKLKPGETSENEVVIFNISTSTASGMTVSRDYIDYLHFARCNGEWKIINAVWEFKNPPAPETNSDSTATE